MPESDHSTESEEEHANHDDEHEEHANHEEAHDDEAEERTVITSGRNFEEEYRVDASEAGKFLINLGEQLRDDDELTIVGDEWELPFAFGEPVEMELDYDGMGEPELEIELEIPGRTDEEAPDVE